MYLPPPSTLPPGSIVDSYRRDSGGMRQDQSTDQQLTELEAYCQAHNLIHRHRFVDEARSGGSTAGRDDFNKMMDLYILPDQRPHGLLLWNYARFARDIDDAQLNKIRIRKWGITIHSLNDSIPEGEHGRIIEYLIDVTNEEKRKQTSADAKRGLKDLVEKYGCVPGTPPRGFKRQPVTLGIRRDKTEHIAHRWVPDPTYKARIQKAFALKAAGATLLQIHKATHLYTSLNSYRTFFQNRLYIGILDFGEITVQNYCAPIIDLKTWDVVQKILAHHSDLQAASSPTNLHPRRRSETATYLLSGIVHCARCNSPLWGMSSKQRNGEYYLRYACTRAKRNRDCDLQPIPARALEGHVINSLHLFFNEPSNIADLLEQERLENEELRAQSAGKLKSKNKELAILRRSITNTANHLSTRSKKSKALLDKLDELENQETQLQTEIAQLKHATPNPQPPLTAPEILILSKHLSRLLAGKSPLEVRTGISVMIKSIYVDRQGNQVTGIINFKKRTRPPHPDDEEGSPVPPNSRPSYLGEMPKGQRGRIITASSSPAPMGAHLRKRSITFSFVIASQGNQKRPRL